MTPKNNIYWVCQFSGWLFYTAINLLFFKLSYTTNTLDIFIFLLWFPLGISITHLFRSIIKKINIVKCTISSQLFFIIGSSFIMACLFFLVNVFILKIFSGSAYQLDVLAALTKILSLMLIFIIWSVIYFGFHFFDNYKQTEIQNLRLEASKNETELNTLKSQLNPHFMFNSMNSIRALIEENPQKAKLAVTQLANILRNTLLMNKSKFITLEEELKLVADYLALEHIRYEERLRYHLDITKETLQMLIPPMMIQTLAENGIKHGISNLPDGGEINVKTSVINNQLHIEVYNTGQLNTENSNSGIGVNNTTTRLLLLYGNNATFNLLNYNENTVLSEIIINL